MNEDDRSDIEDVMREEKSRGRRPVDTEALRRREELLRGFSQLLQAGDERRFRDAMRALGLKDDSAEFREALRIWRENRQR